mmetsp:Transcript_8653/g.28504  ORF Transcript_8653/g.28504 Transcript_8653/m.28504 type:complete len:202 (+) Transcript_8653:690-1295(+)
MAQAHDDCRATSLPGPDCGPSTRARHLRPPAGRRALVRHGRLLRRRALAGRIRCSRRCHLPLPSGRRLPFRRSAGGRGGSAAHSRGRRRWRVRACPCRVDRAGRAGPRRWCADETQRGRAARPRCDFDRRCPNDSRAAASVAGAAGASWAQRHAGSMWLERPHPVARACVPIPDTRRLDQRAQAAPAQYVGLPDARPRRAV